MTTQQLSEINNSMDTIDIRDVIARMEYLEGQDIGAEEEEAQERASLKALLEDLAGSGGDEQWRGNWYPITLISDSYFRDYAEELAEDIGAINANHRWPYTCIDWDQAAKELQQDYFSVEFGSATYWTH